MSRWKGKQAKAWKSRGRREMHKHKQRQRLMRGQDGGSKWGRKYERGENEGMNEFREAGHGAARWSIGQT